MYVPYNSSSLTAGKSNAVSTPFILSSMVCFASETAVFMLSQTVPKASLNGSLFFHKSKTASVINVIAPATAAIGAA